MLAGLTPLMKKLEKCQNAEDVDSVNAPVAFHRNKTR